MRRHSLCFSKALKEDYRQGFTDIKERVAPVEFVMIGSSSHRRMLTKCMFNLSQQAFC